MADDAQKDWVLRILGFDCTTGQLNAPTAEELDLPGRLAAAGRGLSALKAEGDPALPKLMAVHAAAEKEIAAGGKRGAELLDALEGALARALSAARGRKAQAGAEGAVEYGKLLLRWHTAQQRVGENLVALSKALLTDKEIIEDPDFDEIEDAIEDLPDLVPDLGGKLDDLLDEARKPGADRKALNREALGVLSDYRKRLDAVKPLRNLESFSRETSAGQVALFSEFSEAFNDLEAELSKAL